MEAHEQDARARRQHLAGDLHVELLVREVDKVSKREAQPERVVGAELVERQIVAPDVGKRLDAPVEKLLPPLDRVV